MQSHLALPLHPFSLVLCPFSLVLWLFYSFWCDLKLILTARNSESRQQLQLSAMQIPICIRQSSRLCSNSMYNWPEHSLELGFGLGLGIEFSSRIQAECRKTATTFLCYAAVCSVASRPLVSSNFAVLGVSFESQTKENKKDTCSHTLPCLFHLSLFLICAFCSLPAS